MAKSDDPLESFFEAGRRAAPEPSDALLARIEADALSELEARQKPEAAETHAGLRGVLATLGGWRVGAGLASAALAGVVLGAVLPGSSVTLEGLPLIGSGYEISDFAPGYGFDLLEDG